MPHPLLDENNNFIIADYARRRPFTSFLPGIAGRLGVPLWVFYVNRGQAICSFGIQSKDSPLLEFQPANKAYQLTASAGFRTFLKLGGAQPRFCEPFAAQNLAGCASQRMRTGLNELWIEETYPTAGLSTTVRYFSLPGESFAGLARQVTITNTSPAALPFELLDGLPAVIPYGVNNFLLKELGRTVEAWMEVFNHPAGLPFFRLRASVIDRVEVETFQAGHFALALVENGDAGRRLPVLVDPAAVFGADTSFGRPQEFLRRPLAELLAAPQVTCGRTPCAFFAHQGVLEPGAALTLSSLWGHSGGLELIEAQAERLAQPGYFEQKFAEARALALELSAPAETHTADPLFDAYCRQNFLDNVLRGGWPALLGDPARPFVYPLYSRKHGDPERDYNGFVIAPEPYSQGEGSYRDVNQNRRDNVWVNPAAGDFDIRTFVSLIQLDGYNPRVVQGSSFSLSSQAQEELLAGLPGGEALRALLAKPFTPGRLLRRAAEAGLELPGGAESFLNQVLARAEQHLQAEFFEGFWIDHWEYNLDLIESYLGLFPEQQDRLFFGPPDLPFYDSPAFVQPRARKYVLSNGQARQIGSLREDPEKAALIAARAGEAHWARAEYGQGEIYRANLFAKLALTALLKFASRDPAGMGIEMEASRPGWYDALNGLPALFGSGLSETYELRRLLLLLRGVLRAHGAGELHLPVEAAELLDEVLRHLADGEQDEHAYWDAVSSARETYRERTRLGVDGRERAIPLDLFDSYLASFVDKVEAGLARACEMNNGLPPTYFTFAAEEVLAQPECDPQGRPYVRIRRFNPQPLPLFLEGPVHAYPAQAGVEAARRLYQQVRASALYDRQLRMYRVNASLESQPQDIGRARAFPPGWLENESIWLHMEYKYLLATLRAGLYDEFCEDFHAALVPFLDPQVYGRSLLENSSFLASSAHPDPSYHGAGFVARLSGSTAEFISIWRLMLAGSRPFILPEGRLCLALRPVLPAWLFDEQGEVRFRFLGDCLVTYHNPRRLDTWRAEAQPERVTLRTPAGEFEFAGGAIPAPYAGQIRAGLAAEINLYF